MRHPSANSDLGHQSASYTIASPPPLTLAQLNILRGCLPPLMNVLMVSQGMIYAVLCYYPSPSLLVLEFIVAVTF